MIIILNICKILNFFLKKNNFYNRKLTNLKNKIKKISLRFRIYKNLKKKYKLKNLTIPIFYSVALISVNGQVV